MPRYATVVKKGVFDSAHRNTGFGDGHKCAEIHGHTFNYEVHVRSLINDETGLSIDFGAVKKAMKDKVEAVLDHKYLNEKVEYFKNVPPSAENIAFFIFEEVQNELQHMFFRDELSVSGEVVKVELHETPTSSIIITLDDFPYPPGDYRAEVSD